MSNILNCLAAAPALMPMPGEAMRDGKAELNAAPPTAAPVSAASPNQRPTADTRHASRRRSLELVSEAQGDVDGFVKELDQKRRQLDDHIHKFIAQKEREFKLYERELRTRYRTPSNPPPASPSITTQPCVPANEDPTPAVDKGHERESELLGLFTPAYLPLLESRPAGPGRSPSAPPLTEAAASLDIGPDRQSLQRSHTDPATLSPRLALGPRTPSSGSDPGRSLVSALKSPSAGPRLPKQKRVSLIVGDEVVAPSDNVSSNADNSSEHRADRVSDARVVGVQQDTQQEKEVHNQSVSQPPEPAQVGTSAQQSPQKNKQPGGLSLGFASVARDDGSLKDTLQTSVEPQADLELNSPFSMDEEFEGAHSSDHFTTLIEDVDIDSGLDSESTLRAGSPGSSPEQHPSPTDLESGLDVPITRFRSSSSSSAQPISPGFSRPSVRQDPQFNFANEPPAGSPARGSLYESFSRPSYSKQQQTSGSLGESFMQRNAEEMMRRRQSTPRS